MHASFSSPLPPLASLPVLRFFCLLCGSFFGSRKYSWQLPLFLPVISSDCDCFVFSPAPGKPTLPIVVAARAVAKKKWSFRGDGVCPTKAVVLSFCGACLRSLFLFVAPSGQKVLARTRLTMSTACLRNQTSDTCGDKISHNREFIIMKPIQRDMPGHFDDIRKQVQGNKTPRG